MMETVDLENRFLDECNEFIQIVAVMDESPADKAGLRKNDIIVKEYLIIQYTLSKYLNNINKEKVLLN